jgi:hypothetical protein
VKGEIDSGVDVGAFCKIAMNIRVIGVSVSVKGKWRRRKKVSKSRGNVETGKWVDFASQMINDLLTSSKWRDRHRWPAFK